MTNAQDAENQTEKVTGDSGVVTYPEATEGMRFSDIVEDYQRTVATRSLLLKAEAGQPPVVEGGE